MFKLNEEQLKWKELIKNTDRVLIYADRCTGKTATMRTISGNVVMFVDTYHEVKQYQCKESNIKTMVFNRNSYTGHHPDLFIFDDVQINRYNFYELETLVSVYSESKIAVIGTRHYWRIPILFDKVGVINEMQFERKGFGSF